MSSEDVYFEEWPLNIPIEGWREGRAKLNELLRLVNDWTLEGAPADKAPAILRRLDMAIQTWASPDRAGGWADELRRAETYVREKSDAT